MTHKRPRKSYQATVREVLADYRAGIVTEREKYLLIKTAKSQYRQGA